MSAYRSCPFCGEQVLEVAKKCKHCRETIDVTLRAAEEAKRAAEKGPQVFMNAGGGGAASSSASSASSSTEQRNRLGIGCLILVLCYLVYVLIKGMS